MNLTSSAAFNPKPKRNSSPKDAMQAIDACNVVNSQIVSCIHLEQLSTCALTIDLFESLYGTGQLSESLRVTYHLVHTKILSQEETAAQAELKNFKGKKMLQGAPGTYNSEAMKRVPTYNNRPQLKDKLADYWNWWKGNVESKETSEFLKPF